MKTDKIKSRSDDYEKRREHLKDLSDEALKARFWELTNQIVSPLIELARGHTTPSIERSVLLRMGFSGSEAKELVEKTVAHKLIGKGAGHIVYRLAQIDKTDIRTAGLKLINNEGWNRVLSSFAKGESHA